MANRDRSSREEFVSPIRRILIGFLVVLCLGVFLLWRIDSPRVERFRSALIDRIMPSFEWATVPTAGLYDMVENFQSYNRLYKQNQELRRELQKMKSWKEAADRLEQQNAKLLALNNVRLDPRLTSISGVVIADSGSPFRQSVLINLGNHDRIVDGWAVMDGLGLVGRVSGVGNRTSRVVLLTDAASRIPVTILPSGQKGIAAGNNSVAPLVEFLEDPEKLEAGNRVVTSGDGKVFPAGLLVGHLLESPDGRMRVRLAADYERLEFLRVLRSHSSKIISDQGGLIISEPPRNIEEGRELSEAGQ